MKGTTRANLGETVRPLYAKDRILNVVARKCNQEETGSETEKQNKDRKWATTLKSIPANLQAEVGLENAVRYRKDRLRSQYLNCLYSSARWSFCLVKVVPPITLSLSISWPHGGQRRA